MDHLEQVQAMQDYIRLHAEDEDFTIEKVCDSAGYSRRHAERIFQEYVGKTLQEYINAVCLTQGASALIETDKTILEIAGDSHFETHEGFTRSFRRRFRITPSQYRREQIAIPMFVQYPVSHYRVLQNHKEEKIMNRETQVCMVTPQKRERRKLIYLPSQKATDYMSYCGEVGCDWEGLLNSIPEKLDTAALIDLPAFLVKDGWTKTAAGVEVPLEYDKPIPGGCRVAELDACTMLYFQTEPYERSEEFCIAIEAAYRAVEKYDPAAYGYRFAYDLAPSFNFGAAAETGAKVAVPAVEA